jgi:hypothetical protein
MHVAGPPIGRPRVIAIAMLSLALALRLAWPGLPPLSPEAALAAAFGEHALCVSEASAGDIGQSLPPGESPAPRHAGHDEAGCCQWHASSAVMPSGAATATRIAFPTRVELALAADSSPPRRGLGGPQARGPPLAS